MAFQQPWELRAAFARRLSGLYGTEVPAYTTLVDVASEVNADVVSSLGAAAERLGSIGRVTAERHGAIRVGTPSELGQVARIFGAMGMHPVGYYDLRDAAAPVPVVSTAFRPIAAEELARNPFRVFTSVLATSDRRFFNADLQHRLEAFLARRELFPAELLQLADRGEAQLGLDEADAERFLELGVAAFALSSEPVDRAWYRELEEISSVASDIGGVTSTHINHLTPRVLDIDELYARMSDRGITMIDAIQGPPRWDGPEVLLRQTSFRALAEPRRFREADGSISTSSLRVRFGEVEARGIALTERGRSIYDSLMAAVDTATGHLPREDAEPEAARVWATGFPATETGMATTDIGYFTFTVADKRPAGPPPSGLGELIRGGWVVAEPIVYEDFLPRSAAGIFQSNLSGEGTSDASQDGSLLDEAWLAAALGRPIHDPNRLYSAQREASLADVRAALELDTITIQTPGVAL